ncbi:protein translocase subunit SecD [Azospirillum rugosum]|uniref:Protein translocase subunit SecD n=1 Tax=Azospirillum rugosum TaxID=416170 RepID=A0ABS4SE04_9PROT|nr:protein translocase subunit SecD [Azospirillum rugosum]MBP2290789.1 preprotein translocase subunit SecD [Azospirillum rugosum]MDQ0529656.1 preprotein translocase subunit SecD [Azospirillum rugosum]
MLYFPRWKTYLIIAVCVLGTILSLPNFLSRETLAALPDWYAGTRVNLGLDLRGGSHLLLEVDMNAVIHDRVEGLVDSARTQLRTANIGYTAINAGDRGITVQLRDPAQADDAVKALRPLANTIGGGALGGGQPDLDIRANGGTVTATLSEVAMRDRATQAIEQSIEIVRRRIDETGVNEPIIARQGNDRILVQLPGVEDPDRIKRLLGTTAKMTFRLVDMNADPTTGRAPPGSEVLPSTEGGRNQQSYVVRKKVEVDGANLKNATAGTNPQTGEWVVNFEFDSVGARRFADVTRANVSRPFAIVLDNKVISAPVIREPITGGRGQISGSFTAAGANDLAVLLRAGALPAPLKVIEERTVGPDLGADSIRAGLMSVTVGFVLVCAYMLAAYGLFGAFACFALLINIVLTLAALSMLHATLTLPGIAGILLSLGLSVDANILINERIREETKKGRGVFGAMEAGFSRAYSTIVDSNLTTVIKMALLFIFGTGAIKGFAVTITFGILISMFTATVLVRLMMVSWLRQSRPAALPV